MQRIPKEKIVRALMKEIQKPNEERDTAILRVIRSIPRGKVATYSQIAGAAGYPMYARLVARILRHSGGRLPWQRVVGAGGEIKLHLDAALEQRFRLEMEGVTFRGRRVDMTKHQHVFRMWEEK